MAPFDGDFRTLMGRDDLRGYVIFDETPTFINPFVEFDRSMLGIFGKTDENGNIVCKPPEELGRYYDLSSGAERTTSSTKPTGSTV